MRTADEAEERIIEFYRQLNAQLLSSWCQRREQRLSESRKADPELRGAGKKLSWNTTFRVISIEETLFRKGTETVGDFASGWGLSCCGVSLALQRVVVDFGADDPFARAGDKLHEHYGLELLVSRIRELGLRYGKAMLDGERLQGEWPRDDGVGQVIAQTVTYTICASCRWARWPRRCTIRCNSRAPTTIFHSASSCRFWWTTNFSTATSG